MVRRRPAPPRRDGGAPSGPSNRSVRASVHHARTDPSGTDDRRSPSATFLRPRVGASFPSSSRRERVASRGSGEQHLDLDLDRLHSLWPERPDVGTGHRRCSGLDAASSNHPGRGERPGAFEPDGCNTGRVVDLSSLESISRRAHELLQRRPHTPDELIGSLQSEGYVLGADPHDLLFEVLADDNVPVGDRWVNLPAALDGSRWWIRVPADSGDRLPLDDGVEVITFWHWDETPLLDADGTVVGALHHQLSADCVCLSGPEGWLSEVAGGAAVLTFRHDGISVLPADGEPAAVDEMAAAFRSSFEAEAEVFDDPLDGDGDGEPLCIAEHGMVYVQAFVDHPDVMRSAVIPSCPTLLAAAGLEAHGLLVGRIGTDWAAHDAARRFHELRSHHELSQDDTTSVMMVLGACHAVLEGRPDAFGDDGEREGNAFVLAMALNSADVCRVFVHEAIEHGRTPEDLLRFSAEVLRHIGDGPGCSGPEVVAAECLDLLDRTDDAIAALGRAVRHDPHPRAHGMLAGFAADRGDAVEAARLLRAGGISPDQARLGGGIWGEIEPFLQRPKALAERNDPCPCGSGRKYKACHLGKEQHPLRDRSAWLYRKACRFVGEHMLHEHAELAMALVDAAGGSPQLLSQVIDSELVYDITLEEGAGFRRFIERRRSLLPTDERDLASLWLLADRSVYRVDDHGQDWLALTDLATDEAVRITNVRGMRVRQGSNVAARLLPVGSDLVSYFGYVPVPSMLVDEVLEVLADGDALPMAEALGRCFAPEFQDPEPD